MLEGKRMNFVIKNFFNTSIKLIFIGCIHTRDTSLIPPLKKEIEDFNPDIIYKNEEESIEKGGEMGYVSFLASKYNINYKKILILKGEHHLNTPREKIKKIITNV